MPLTVMDHDERHVPQGAAASMYLMLLAVRTTITPAAALTARSRATSCRVSVSAPVSLCGQRFTTVRAHQQLDTGVGLRNDVEAETTVT